jgi:hypothetical protein
MEVSEEAAAKGLIDDRLHRGQGILDPMVQLVAKQPLLLFSLLPIGDIAARTCDGNRPAIDALAFELDKTSRHSATANFRLAASPGTRPGSHVDPRDRGARS